LLISLLLLSCAGGAPILPWAWIPCKTVVCQQNKVIDLAFACREKDDGEGPYCERMQEAVNELDVMLEAQREGG